MKKLLLFLFVIGCSNTKALYTHSDNMSRLITKQLVLDRFGEPTAISKEDNIDEYYYDFGVFNQRVNYYHPNISTVSPNQTFTEYNMPMSYAERSVYKYIKFKMIKDSVISWESSGVNFATKKKKNQK
tara:strand:- start:1544 stop:1927 length:384 start_codon:yes stop_codon:yes gene_type:complete